MTLLESVLLGVIEGLTEFLPVSSTGHLILAAHLLSIPQTEFVKTFEIAIQLGSIAAVVALFWRRFLDPSLLKRLFVAFLPTGLVGFLLYPVIKGYLIGNELIVVAALFLGGLALIAFEYLHKEGPDAADDPARITYRQCLSIGLFQALAVIPGVSRAAATILGGLLVGLKRTAIVEFSFLLAVPTMLAAVGYDMLQTAGSFSQDEFGILAAGFLTAFAVAMLAIRLLLAYVKTRTFVPFGIYRIALAAAFFLVFLA